MKLEIIAIAATIVAFDAQAAAAQQAETWQLAEVNGAALPAVVETDDDGCRDEVVSGTLTLSTGGMWKLTTNEREVCGNRVEEETEEEDGRYTVQGETIRFDDDDDDADDDDGSDDDVDDFVSATRSGTTLTVRLEGDRTLVFRR
ncbi:MAG TPA: hypothetical protein VF039_00220 [Longimicrobiales bacterium]